MTGSHRTTLQHDWNSLSLASQIIESLGYNVTAYGANDPSVLRNLRAVGHMARRDSVNPRWLRTREQVDGGVYPDLLMQLRSRQEVEEFLIDYDITRTNPIDKAELQARVAALKKNLRIMSPSAYGGLISQLARIHNCTFLLDKFPKKVEPPTPISTTASATSVSTPGNSAQTPIVIRSTRTVIDLTGSDDTSFTPSTPVKADPGSNSTRKRRRESSVDAHVRSTKRTATRAAADIPAKSTSSTSSGVLSSKDHKTIVSQYHQDQSLLEKQLYNCRTSLPFPRDPFESLFNWDQELHLPRLRSISLSSYPRIFEAISRIPGDRIDPKIAETLRNVVFNREESQKYHHCLPASDPRHGLCAGHQHMIDILKAGEAMLLRKKT